MLLWEHAHDEGVTYQQTFGRLTVASTRDAPTPIATLYERYEDPQPISGVLRELIEPGGMHPPAYYVGLNLWSRGFGTSQLALAFPALLAGVGALFVMRAVGRELLGRRAGDWAMALLASSGWFASYLSLLRPYGVAVCIALAATLAALRFARAPLPNRSESGSATRAALCFVLLSALGLYTIYHYAFVLLWHGVLLVALATCAPSAEKRVRLGGAIATGLAIALLYAPWAARAVFHLRITGARPWYFSGVLPLEEWPERGALVLQVFGLGELAIAAGAEGARSAFGVLGWIAVAAALYALATRWRSASTTLKVAIATLPVMPLAVAVADLATDSHTLFYSKTSFGLFPILVLAVVGGAGAIRTPRWAASALLATWVALLAASSIWNLSLRAATDSAPERLAKHLVATSGNGRLHRLVVPSVEHGYFIPVLLALRDAGVVSVEVQHVPPDRFDAWLREALGETGGGLVTLAHLAVIPSSGEQGWSAAQLERASRSAAARGWAVRPLRLRGELLPAAAERPTLWLTPLLAPKYFSM